MRRTVMAAAASVLFAAAAHAEMAHHDAVRGGGCAEDLRHAAAGAYTFDALAGEPVEVGIAGSNIAE